MTLMLYNTLTNRKEPFEPVQPGRVGIYLCGPTVYKPSHIGHAVGPVIFDALKKYLTFKGYQVTLVINITDVDDKLLIEARERGTDIKTLAEEVSAGYFEAMAALGVDSVDHYPRATDHVKSIIALIQRMEQRDAAYAVNGDVYCDVSKSPDYGKLSNRRGEDQMEGTRTLAGAGKRNPADFALWKAAAEDEVGWDSPWGRGRPGWHIECSAMSMDLLGETFDIHGGGMDLIFPHHENEIAQSELATGKPYVRYWMHNGLTRIRTKAAGGEWQTEKMSKSLGNVKELHALLQTYPGALIRFFLLSTHYRRPIDFSEESLEAVRKGMMGLYRLLERVGRLGGAELFQTAPQLDDLETRAASDANRALLATVRDAQGRYVAMLDDDFNTAGAIAELHELGTAINRYIEQEKLETAKRPVGVALVVEAARALTHLGRIIGLLTEPLAAAPGAGDELTEKLMGVLIELRAQARREKNFALADAIRDQLKAIGVELEDRPDGTGWRRAE